MTKESANRPASLRRRVRARVLFEAVEPRLLLTAQISVLGNSVAIANGDSTPAATDFTDFGYNDVGTTSVTRTFTIKNTGDTNLTLNNNPVVTVTGTDPSDFTITTLPSSTVAAGGTTTFVVTFLATAPGARVATINFASNSATDATFTFTVKGTALAMDTLAGGLETHDLSAGSGNGAISGDTLVVNYTGWLLNGLKFDSSLNAGRGPFTVTLGQNSVIQGWEQGLLGIKQGGERILIIPASLAYGSSGQGNIPANATLIFDVTRLTDTPVISVLGNGSAIANGDTSPTRNDLTDFGFNDVNNTGITRTFTIKNTGNMPLNLTGNPLITVSGANASDFTVTTLPDTSVAAAGTTTFVVTFKSAAAGTRTATINIASDSVSNSAYSFTVQGTAYSFATGAGGLETYDISAGSGTGAVVGNTVVVDYIGWLLDGTQFDTSVGGSPLTVTLGQNSVIQGWEQGLLGMKPGTLRVLIVPASLGYGSAGHDLTVPPDATLIFEISRLTDPQISILGNNTAITNGDTTPSSTDLTDFGYNDVNNTSITRTFTITNTGDQALSLTGNPLVTVTGANASDFTVTTFPASTSLASGATTTFVVTFKASAAGSRTAVINVVSNSATGSSYSFTVQGAAYNFTTGTGGLETYDVIAGTGTAATSSSKIVIDYTGWLLNGTIWGDTNTRDTSPLNTTLGSTGVAGLDAGLVGLKPGGKRVLIIPASLAFGSAGSGSIPANAILVMEVTRLVDGPRLSVQGFYDANSQPYIPPGEKSPLVTDATDFGTFAPTGQASTHYFLISNIGNSTDLNLPGTPMFQITGANASDFTVSPTFYSNSTYGYYFYVSFTPKGADGVRKATIVIPNTTPDVPFYNFDIQATVAANAPDLSGVFASSAAIPANVTVGDTFTAPIVISNANGSKTASGTVNIVVKASADGTWHDSDPTVGTVSGKAISIANNGSTTVGVPVTIPNSATLALGSYKLVAKIVASAGMGETVVNNNVVTAKWTAAGPAIPMNVLPALPDLTLSIGVAGLVSITPGQVLTIPLTIANIGVRSATIAGGYKISLRLSGDNAYDVSDDLITDLTYASTIARGGMATVNASVTIPLGIAAGSYYLVGQVDSTGLITEVSDSNNNSSNSAMGTMPVTFNDADGTKVTIKLNGVGTAIVTSGASGYDIAIAGTTSASGLTITTVKSATPGDDGRFTLHVLTIGNSSDAGDRTSIGAISAATTDLSGNIAIAGTAASILWGNIAGQHTLTIGTPAVASTSAAVSLTFGSVQNLTITSGIGISLLKAANWADTDATADSVNAPWLASLNITGSAALALAGNFQANLNLTSTSGASSSAPTLGTVLIAGSVGGNTWDIAGKATTVTIKGTAGTIATAWTLKNFASATTLSLGDVVNGVVTTTGAISTIAAQRWQAGSISAKTLTTLNVTGRAATLALPAAIAGDFLANLTLAGPGASATSSVLGTATIAGIVGGNTWDITGNIGTVKIAGTAGTADTAFTLTHAVSAASWTFGNVTKAALTLTGNLGTFTAGDVTTGTLTVGGALTTFKALRWLGGAVSAKTMRTFSVTGRAATLALPTAIAGDFNANLTCNGPTSAAVPMVLVSATVAGSVGGNTWSLSGRISSITINGTVGTADTPWTLNQVLGSPTITLGDVINGVINTPYDLGVTKAKRWQAGSIAAHRITSLQTTGTTGVDAYAGDFKANVTLSGTSLPVSTTVLGSATIGGSVGTGTWNLTGSVGSITVNGTAGTVATAWQLKNVINATSIKLSDVTNATVTATGTISLLSAQRWVAGQITAPKLGTLSITGQLILGGFAGDFGANITLSGTASAPTLGTAAIAGNITGGTWSITGAAGTISAKAVAAGNTWTSHFSNKVTSLALTDPLATSQLSLDALSIGTLTVSASLSNSLVTLSQAVSSTLKALGTLTIGGTMGQSEIRSAGNMGALTIGAMDRSNIFAGVNASLHTLPRLTTDFVTATATSLPTIASLTLKGLLASPTSNVFVNSAVAAGTITTVKLPLGASVVVDSDGIAQAFGFATRTAKVAGYTGPASSGDFVDGNQSLVS